jgi:hypothetical protein
MSFLLNFFKAFDVDAQRWRLRLGGIAAFVSRGSFLRKPNQSDGRFCPKPGHDSKKIAIFLVGFFAAVAL